MPPSPASPVPRVEPHQQRLELVVGGVGGGDRDGAGPARRREQELAAQAPQTGLAAQARAGACAPRSSSARREAEPGGARTARARSPRSPSASAPRRPWCRWAARISSPRSRARRERPSSSAVESAPPLTATSTRLPAGTAHAPLERATQRGLTASDGRAEAQRVLRTDAAPERPTKKNLVAAEGLEPPTQRIMIPLLYQLSYTATWGAVAGTPRKRPGMTAGQGRY